ncbi:hypothetical protein G9A89_005537 [Geosiphon pyriformis]|nr:hypothetical protein G9A89_005537 [Geosiphon pyriformis]
MLPSPETSYSSCEMMIQSLKTFRYSQRYVVTKRRSAANGTRITFKCDRRNEYNASKRFVLEDQQRKTATRLTNCPFTVYERLLKADERWHLTVCNAEHNHEPSDNIAEHPTA